MINKKALTLLLILPVFSTPLLAVDIVHDFGNTAQSITNSTNQINQLKNQLLQLQEQSKYLKQELQTLKAGAYKWGDAQTLINATGDLMNQTNSLYGSAQNINKQFKTVYPGYKPTKDYDKEYQTMMNTSLNTINNTMDTVNMTANDFANQTNRLQYLQNQTQTVTGQTQAIQVAAEIASEEASQLQLIHQTLLSQTTEQSAYYATQIQDQATFDATMNKILSNGTKSAPKIGYSGETIHLPTL